MNEQQVDILIRYIDAAIAAKIASSSLEKQTCENFATYIKEELYRSVEIT